MIHLQFDTAGLQGIRDLLEDNGSYATSINGCGGGPIMGAYRLDIQKRGFQEDEFDLESGQERDTAFRCLPNRRARCGLLSENRCG